MGRPEHYADQDTVEATLPRTVEVPDMNLAIQVAIQSQQIVEFSYS